MNPYVFETCCDLCGGPGAATGQGVTAQWTGGMAVHKNPATCQYYIQKRERELKQKIAEQETK